jgi:hypothetical protein
MLVLSALASLLYELVKGKQGAITYVAMKLYSPRSIFTRSFLLRARFTQISVMIGLISSHSVLLGHLLCVTEVQAMVMLVAIDQGIQKNTQNLDRL